MFAHKLFSGVLALGLMLAVFGDIKAQGDQEPPVYQFEGRTPSDWSSTGYGIRVENFTGRLTAFSEGSFSDWANHDILLGVEGPLAAIPIGSQSLGIGWHLRARFLEPDRDAMRFVTPHGLMTAKQQIEIIGLLGLDTNAAIRNQRQHVSGQWADRFFVRVGPSFAVRTVDNMPSQRMAVNAIIGEALWLKNLRMPRFIVAPAFPGQRPLDVAYVEAGGWFSHPLRHYDESGREIDEDRGVVYQTYPDHGLTAYGAGIKALLKLDARWLAEAAPALVANAGVRFAYERQEVRKRDLEPEDRDTNNDVWTRAIPLSLTYITSGWAVTAEYQRVSIIGGDRYGPRPSNPNLASPESFEMFRLWVRITR